MSDWYEYVRAAQVRDQEHWNDIGHYGVSKIGGCLQKTWFEILGKYTENYKPSTDFKKIFFIGTAVHELIQNYAEERGAIKERKITYTSEDGSYSVMSYIDLIDPEVGIIDIKTSWSKPENYAADSAIHQLNFYMGVSGIHCGGILVIALNNTFEPFKKEDIFFISHTFDHKLFKEDLDKLQRLTDTLKRRVPVEEYSETYCKYCEYDILCPKRAEHDQIYKTHWKNFMEEVNEYEKREKEKEQRKKDATSDGYYTGEKPFDLGGIEIDFGGFNNV